MRVFILQGLPGSGKSTYIARRWAAQEGDPDSGWEEVVSADQFFMVGGEYRFDPARLAAAHGDCLRRYAERVVGEAELQRDGVKGGPQALIVDNTNTTIEEVARYYALGQAFGFEVEILYFPCAVETALARNTHNVPEGTIRGMAADLERFAQEMRPWWVRRTVAD